MQTKHLGLRQALGPGKAHIVGAHHFDRTGPRQADQQAQLEQRKVERRQHQMAQAFERSNRQFHAQQLGDWPPAPRGQPAQFHRKTHDQ